MRRKNESTRHSSAILLLLRPMAGVRVPAWSDCICSLTLSTLKLRTLTLCTLTLYLMYKLIRQYRMYKPSVHRCLGHT